MSFDVFGFDSSISNSSSLQQVNALADSYLPPQNNNLVVKSRARVGGLWAIGTNLTRVQLQSPSLRRFINPEYRPFANAVPGGGQQWAFHDLTHAPIMLDPTEQLSAFATQGSAGAQIARVFLLLFREAAREHVADKIVSVRVTSSTTLVAEAWTACQLTLDQALPAGKYQVVGARMESATGVAFRLIFPNDPARPGGPMFASGLGIEPRYMRYGRGGVWGEFTQNDALSAEIVATAADTSQVGVLDLVRVE
jgi:hypothetical protein